MSADSISAFMRLLTSALGAGHPMRLLLGISCGLLAKMLITASAATSVGNAFLTALDSFNATWFILIITPLFFAPLIFGQRGAPESAVHQVRTLDLLIERSGMKSTQRQMLWHSLIQKYVDAAQPDFASKPDLGKMFADAKAEVDGESS